jgi:CrcB protein
MTFLVLTVAGAIGGWCRYALSGAVQGRTPSDFPLGTLAVNLSGAFILGLLVGIDNLQSATTMAAAGFLGGFTTFSTWMMETIRLGLPTFTRRAFTNLALSFIAGVALAGAGYSLTT